MSDVVIIEAVRTPVGRRGGGLSGVHPANLLGTVLGEVVRRSGIDPARTSTAAPSHWATPWAAPVPS